MEKVFISKIIINKVRHLEKLEIPLAGDEMKHLIITGKNGSGKTSLLDRMALFLDAVIYFDDTDNIDQNMEKDSEELYDAGNILLAESKEKNGGTFQRRATAYEKGIQRRTCGVELETVPSISDIPLLFREGKFVAAYYRADRIFQAQVPKYVEKVELKNGYFINETPRKDFIRYLLDLKMTEALAVANGKGERAQQIRTWFEKFQDLLKKIFENDSVRLVFDEDTFRFSLEMDGRESFDFNTLSSGYAAIMDIVVDLIIRMEKHSSRIFDFSMPGIVLIDEIETHLHLELQRKILDILTTVFPNVQFIVSTHSPFILNSLENVVIYDLENKLLVENGLSDIPYSGIVEGYFNADEMSMKLREKYDRYKELIYKQDLTDDDFDEIADLELYLDEIPDYLALNITTEYQRLKQELRKRDDI